MAKRKTIKGILQKNKKGFGFLIPEDKSEDVFIPRQGIYGAMNGDTVEIDLIPKEFWKNSREGIVVKVVERRFKEVVGTFEKSKRFGFVVPDDKRVKEDVFINKKFFNGAQRGDKVVATITKYPDKNNSAEGEITQIISRFGEAGGDIKALVRQYNLSEAFTSKVNEEANAIASGAIKKEEIEKRRDIRNKRTITIDGADSKDFDDAVSCEVNESGNFLLGVHIADVSHYVKEGSFLDKEALKRGNSVYLIDQVIPMLPRVLSNGICSLNPKEERLTLTCEMEIDESGEIISHEIYESVIVSDERMVYGQVSDIIEGKDDSLKEKYNHIYEDIMTMARLAKILEKKRKARGSLDFDFDEAHIILDEAGIPVNIGIAERKVANKLIEEFMLVANEVVAEHFFWLEAPFVYRVHEKPSSDKMKEFAIFLKGFGLSLKGDTDSVHPKTLNNILNEAKGEPYENILSTVMLRSMQKAVYSTDCNGHFGLSLKYYCHFTSPIRRYADLMIHRIIKLYLHKEMDSKIEKKLKKRATEAAETTSFTERQAIDLERQVEKMKKAEYMSYHVGEEFEGVISGVTNYGIYVELPNTVEGMVKLEYLTDDYYEYDKQKYRLIGRKTKKIFALGDKINIKVKAVSIEAREIDFTLI